MLRALTLLHVAMHVPQNVLRDVHYYTHDGFSRITARMVYRLLCILVHSTCTYYVAHCASGVCSYERICIYVMDSCFVRARTASRFTGVCVCTLIVWYFAHVTEA